MSDLFEIKRCILFLTLIIAGIESAKILGCFPSSSYSHHLVFKAITTELIKRGHQLTVITSKPMYAKEFSNVNLTEIDISDVSRNIYKKYFTPFITGKKNNLISDVHRAHDVITKISQKVLELKEIKNLLKYKNNDFDLLLLESVYLPFLGFTHIFKAPTILVSSFGSYPGLYEMIGAPTHPTLYGNFYSHKIYNLTLWDKFKEILMYLQINSIISEAEEGTNKLLKNVLGPDTPSLKDLKNNVDMLFLNVNPIWEGNRPVPPNVIYMGGIHQTPPKALPRDLQRYLDRSSNGIIYLSLGTNVNSSILNMHTIEMFKKVFHELPYNILWKWDDDKFPVKSEKIKIYNWLPQADLLRHRNVKIFITQGGLQSTDEAITAGVPLIGIPMLADQWYNVEKYVFHKIGIRLDFEDITEEKFRNAIIEVAESESYRKNIMQLRLLLQDQPQGPLERTIWWIEYVLRHGGAKHLRSPAANISWTEFLELKIFGFITLLIFTSTVVVYVAIRLFVYRFFKIFMLKIKLKKT